MNITSSKIEKNTPCPKSTCTGLLLKFEEEKWKCSKCSLIVKDLEDFQERVLTDYDNLLSTALEKIRLFYHQNA